MYEIVAILTLFLSGYLLVHVIGAAGKAELFIMFFCIVTAEIAVCGYLLSAFDNLGNIRGWALLGAAFAAMITGVALLKQSFRPHILTAINPRSLGRQLRSLRKWFSEETSIFEKLLLIPMVLVSAALGILHLVILINAAPHNFDSMTYRLARMAYYLQQNNMDYYPANFWAQVIMAKNSALFLVYSYLVSFGNENITQFVQFFSYWVAVCSVYGIARRTGNNRTHSVFAALVSSLLVTWLLESTTNQNDMIVAAYFGAAIYFLFGFRERLRKKYLGLAALALGLSFGASAKSFFPLPSALLVAGYVLWTADHRRTRLRNIAYFLVSVFLAVSLFALPAGYVENYQNFGNPIGPRDITQYSFEGKPLAHIAGNGAKNVLRFGFDFLSFDGLLPFDVVRKTQSLLTAAPKAAVTNLGFDLESSTDVIKPFRYQKPLFANEDWHAWGVFGFALIWVVVFLSVIGTIKSRDTKILSFAALLCICVVAFAGYYEPHLIRYFASCAIFAVPPIACVLRRDHKFLRTYLFVIVLLGCLSAVSATVLRANRPPFSINFKGIHLTSVFEKDRVAQLTTNNRRLYRPIRTFDAIVPEDATVAVFLPGDTYEYPLFGKELTRTLIPINPFVGGFQEIPPEAEYLLYTAGFPLASSKDLHLGAGWYLRQL